MSHSATLIDKADLTRTCQAEMRTGHPKETGGDGLENEFTTLLLGFGTRYITA